MQSQKLGNWTKIGRIDLVNEGNSCLHVAFLGINTQEAFLVKLIIQDHECLGIQQILNRHDFFSSIY